MLRKIIRAIILGLFKLLSKTETAGLEGIPKQGGVILVANHLSRLDGPVVFAFVEREDLTGLVADTYRRVPGVRLLVDSIHGIWLNREEADFRALRAARDYLKSGGGLGIAPEGTRSHTGGLIHAKTGAAYLADKAGVILVPLGIDGTHDAMHKLLHLRRPRIKIRVGTPFCLPPLERGDRPASLERNTDEIMCRIAALLPPEHRGVYAAHPRLQELLKMGSCAFQE